MKILILDDMKIRHELFKKKFNLPSDELTHTYTVDDCIHELDNNTFDFICLDHDLGHNQTAIDVCNWLCDNPDRCNGLIIIHSSNPVGAKNMHDILNHTSMRSVIHPSYYLN